MNTLPLPALKTKPSGQITLITDDALASSVGVYMGFTTREGGTSKAPFDSLNLGTHVNDDAQAVQQNRQRVLDALGAPSAALVVPNQVHGTNLVSIASTSDAGAAQQEAAQGADGLLVQAENVAAMLCFADCVPVILVAPSGHFAVVHAGWRGAVAGIVGKAAQELAAQDAAAFGVQPQEVLAGMNMYIGPCIHKECFEVSEEIAQQFAKAYGAACVPDARHVDLPLAVALDAQNAGLTKERIANSDMCTVCSSDTFFSYRASGGVCGRHAAVAIRKEL